MCDLNMFWIKPLTVTCISVLSHPELIPPLPTAFLFCRSLARSSVPWCKIQLTTHRFIISQNNFACISASLCFLSHLSPRHIASFVFYNDLHNVHFFLSPAVPLFCENDQISSRSWCCYLQSHCLQTVCVEGHKNSLMMIFNHNVNDDLFTFKMKCTYCWHY